MVPDWAGRGGTGVDEELVRGLGIELPYPTLGEGAGFVFHWGMLGISFFCVNLKRGMGGVSRVRTWWEEKKGNE